MQQLFEPIRSRFQSVLHVLWEQSNPQRVPYKLLALARHSELGKITRLGLLCSILESRLGRLMPRSS